MRFNLDNYETVESRLAKFWEQFPNGQVFTQIHHYDDNKVVFRAEIYKDISDPRPVATGYAEELRDASPVNRTSHVENAETSAIGRALANFVFQSKTAPRPSREEMAKVARQQEAKQQPKPDADLLTKFRKACTDAGLDPQDVAKSAGVDLYELTNESMPKLRDAFKKLQAPVDPKTEFAQNVAKVFPTADKENYKEIKDPDAPATPAQKGKMRAMLNGAGKSGPAAQTEAVADIISRPVSKLDSLTKAEADKVIKVLDERASR